MKTKGFGRTVHVCALAVAGIAAPYSAQAQAVDADPAPRGQVTAHCYARTELWQRDGRTRVRLLYATVLYDETASKGVQRDLGVQWTKFISDRLSAQARQPGQNDIVYCQYTDSPWDTELANWPASSAPLELVDWPGRSYAGPLRTAAPGPAGVAPQGPPQIAPQLPSQAVPTSAARSPAQAAPALPTVQAAAIAPARTGPTVLTPPAAPHVEDEAAQSQQASAIYDEIKRRDEQRIRDQQARDDAYRQQVEEHQRQMATAQAAQRAFEERQKQYEQERAAYEAKVKGK
ncbi:MAG TPA: hypothetical protein VJM34_15015 [Novosphingobium sp.]|nr:hypothetical protein [Novosphingobium sp.]